MRTGLIDMRVQLDWFGDAVNGEIAAHFQLIGTNDFYLVALEFDGRKLGGVQKAIIAYVFFPRGIAHVQAADLDSRLNRSFTPVFAVELQCAIGNIKAS